MIGASQASLHHLWAGRWRAVVSWTRLTLNGELVHSVGLSWARVYMRATFHQPSGTTGSICGRNGSIATRGTWLSLSFCRKRKSSGDEQAWRKCHPQHHTDIEEDWSPSMSFYDFFYNNEEFRILLERDAEWSASGRDSIAWSAVRNEHAWQRSRLSDSWKEFPTTYQWGAQAVKRLLGWLQQVRRQWSKYKQHMDCKSTTMGAFLSLFHAYISASTW